jgi:subfamily B ATP-binding cassette protein MsbA
VFKGHRQFYLSHLKGSRTLLVVSLLFGLVYASSSALGFPFLVGKILPTVFGSPEQRIQPLLVFPDWLGWAPWYLPKGHEVFFAVSFLPTIFLVRGLSQFISTYLLNLAGLKVVESVRRAVFVKIQEMHLGFFGKMPTGDLLQRIINDANAVRLVLIDISNDLFVQPLTVLLSVVYVIFLCLSKPGGYWFLICLLVIPLVVFVVRYIGRSIQQKAQRTLTSSSSLNTITVENLQSARDVRAYGLQQREQQRFALASAEGLRMQAKLVRYEKALSPLIEFSAALGIALAVGVGAGIGFKFEEILSLITAFYIAYSPIKRIGMISAQINIALPSLARLEEVLNARVEVADAPDAQPLPKVKGEIEFQGMSFAYGEEVVLEIGQLKIPAGQSVALVGPSGAGKSTFVNLVPRFFDPQKGVIKVDGHDLRTLRQADLRANIALVSQEPVLFDETILENIRLGKLGATDDEVREAARLAGALEFIEAQPQGFHTRVGERGMRLSGGQRQRVSIARAFLKNAPILILDEATSALDTDTERSIQESLSHLMVGRTTLIVAHRFSTIRDAQRILVFAEGKIVADGPREEVYRQNDLFRRLWDNQAQGLG